MKKLFPVLLVLVTSSKIFADDISATVTNSVTGQNNGAVMLTISAGIAPFTFSWTGPAGFASTDQDISGLAPGEYCVVVSDAYCGAAQLCVMVEEEIATIIYHEDMMFSFIVYPNPFLTSFVLEATVSNADEYQAEFYNNTGMLAFKKYLSLSAGKNSIEITLPADLPAGNYRMKLFTNNKEVASTSLMRLK